MSAAYTLHDLINSGGGIITLSAAAWEAVYLKGILSEFGLRVPGFLSIWIRQGGAIRLSGNGTFSRWTKNISTRFWLVRQNAINGNFTTHHVPRELQISDILTKPLLEPPFQRLHQLVLDYAGKQAT